MKKISKLVILGCILSLIISTFFFGSLNNSKALASEYSQTEVPAKIYKLIKLDKNVPDCYADYMKEILTLMWQQPNDRLVLNGLCKHKVHIKIANSDKRVFADEETVSISYSPSTANQGDTYNLFYITVFVPARYIKDYANKNLPEDKRLYSLGYIIHELAHAYVYVRNPHNTNSIEQKLTLTMFGYNEANKILTGNYLTKEESVSYSEIALKSIVDYETKKFPIYSGITKKLKRYGFVLQNTEDYTDITAIYNKLLSEGKIKPCISFPKN